MKRIGQLTDVDKDDTVGTCLVDPNLLGIALDCMEEDLGRGFFDPLPRVRWAKYAPLLRGKDHVSPAITLGLFDHLRRQ